MKRLGNSLYLCLIFMFLAAGLPAAAGAASTPDALEFVPGEVIVGFEAIPANIAQAIEARGGHVAREIPALKAFVVTVPAGKEEDFIQRIQNIPGFKYAEQNGIVRATHIPNDPKWAQLWNMRIIQADDAWDIHMGSTSVVIAIVDTGIDYNHEDLATRYVPGGYDWVNSDNDPWDDHYHGTHCAGIAAAVMDNNKGVVGVAQSSLWAEKVLDHNGNGEWDDLANAITHATDNGADIISMSLGGYGYSFTVDSACSYAWTNGVLLVGAAGNDNLNIDVYAHYPAAYDTVMAIAATTSSDARWGLSNYGNRIEVSAPGASVYSTMPNNNYGSLSGTSMATPHVAGVAALLWSYTPSLSNTQMRSRLHQAVDDLGAPGKDIYFGYGRINAYKALTGGEEFQYSFQLDPYSNIIHVNTNPGGWLNGYMTGGPNDWNPVLGKYEAGRFYMAIDAHPDATPGYSDLMFLVGTVATRTGQYITTTDGLSWDGPFDVTLVPVAQTEGSDGSDITLSAGSQVTPDAWYTFQVNPFIDIVDLNTNPGGWLNGFDMTLDPDGPILGFAEMGRFYFAVDAICDGCYTLIFIAGSTSTRDGEIIRTADGISFDGPTYVWLTPA
ncbi:MAG: peptidase S8 [Candidatus Bathyarchaeota archaeon]|nr:MAG: peptidase S8 [Candidatus Bathyarchaeota archaeon]